MREYLKLQCEDHHHAINTLNLPGSPSRRPPCDNNLPNTIIASLGSRVDLYYTVWLIKLGNPTVYNSCCAAGVRIIPFFFVFLRIRLASLLG